MYIPSATHSFQRLRGIVLSLLYSIGVCLDGHVTTSVVLPLFMKITDVEHSEIFLKCRICLIPSDAQLHYSSWQQFERTFPIVYAETPFRWTETECFHKQEEEAGSRKRPKYWVSIESEPHNWIKLSRTVISLYKNCKNIWGS